MKEVKVFIILLALLVVTPMVYAGYEENIREGIFLVRPENQYMVNTTTPTYLENEDLIFFACLEEDNTPIRLSVLCQDTNQFEDIPARKWGELNCFIGSTNLDQFDCSRAVVQADYVSGAENLKLEQEIRINKFSRTLDRIIESQFEDGGWETPLDTAYGLMVISRFENIFTERINQAVDYLKLNRNEEEKCWPQDNCRISTTANILFLLEKAGFEDLRIQHDGYLYLEKTQSYLDGQQWTLDIIDFPLNVNNTFNTSCVYDYEDSTTTFTLPRYPNSREEILTPNHEDYVNIVCTDNIIVNVTNEFGERVLTYQGDNFSYTVPPPCWTENNENLSCDVRATAFAVNTDISSNRLSRARSYLNGLVVDDRVAGSNLEVNWTIINNALYLHGTNTNQNALRTSLRYYQNNSGGWKMPFDYYERTYFDISLDEYLEVQAEADDNVTKNIVATGYAVMGLLETGSDREDEYIIDAERWVSINEDETGMNYTDEDLTDEELLEEYLGNRSLILNDTKRNAMAFYVLQNNARPLLVAEPKVLVMNQDSLELDIINPTIFDLEELTYEFSSDIDEYLTVEDKDFVGAYSFRRVTVSRNTEVPVDDIGYLRIMDDEDEYLKVPVILESAPRLNITLPEELTIFGNTAVLPFNVRKSSHNFQCNLEWTTEGIISSEPFDINNLNGSQTYSFPVRFNVLETERTVYGGNITCIANQVTFKIPFATGVIRFSSRPLQVFPEVISIESAEDEPWITVENLLDQTIEVTVEFANDDPYMVPSDTFLSLYPGESRNVTFEVIPVEGENYTTSNSIIFRTFNIEERVLYTADVIAEEETFLAQFGWIIILVVVVLLVAVAGYFGYRKRDELKKWYETHFKKENLREQILAEVAREEREEELQAIRNMSKILQMQGMKDTDIRSRLIKEGYQGNDIDEALSRDEDKANQEQQEAQ